MFEQFSDQARRLVVQAQEEVRVLHHAELDAAHLLLAIAALPGSDAVNALEQMGTSAEVVQGRTRGALTMGTMPTPTSFPFTVRAQKALERAVEESNRLGDDFVGTAHLLLGLLRAKKGTAVEVLHELGVDLDRARTAVTALASGESNAGVSLQRETTIAGPTGTERAEPPPSVAALGAVRPAPMPYPPPTIGFSPDNNPRCGFCGRDLWDVADYVNGDVGAICSECVAEAHQVIEGAAEDQHSLTLPPRVFGTVPDPGAPRLIEEAFRTVFGTFATPAHRRRLIEDGHNVVRYLEEAQAKFGIRLHGVRLKRIRFVDGRRADVQFALSLSSSHWIPFDGNAVQQDGRWLVSRDTMGRLIQMAGVQLPPLTT